MKTAMQELIDNLDGTLVKSIFERLERDGLFIKALEKEKEQIMNAYCDGAKGGANGTKGQHENGWVSIQMRNKYYKQTYNN
jgi:hypothetical protein